MKERTNKGQPVMKNYISYALTKLEEDFTKEKLSKLQNKNKKEWADISICFLQSKLYVK